MDKNLLELYAYYIISSFGQTMATNILRLLDKTISHDEITRFLLSHSESKFGKQIWKANLESTFGKHIRKAHSESTFGKHIRNECALEKIFDFRTNGRMRKSSIFEQMCVNTHSFRMSLRKSSIFERIGFPNKQTLIRSE